MTETEEEATTGKTTKQTEDDEETNQKSSVEDEPRAQWGNQFQFILSALGLAVGLGNIWRFPYVAYENGGAAFLIPYLCCGFFFGLPMVYAEFMIGQYSRSGPGLALGRYAAGFRGVGWSMSLISVTVAIYYCVIISWAGVYLGWVVSAQSYKWSRCDNDWNTNACVTQQSLIECFEHNATTRFYYNGSCQAERSNFTKGAAEEFFINYVTTRSGSIENFGGMNWPVLGSLFLFWALTTLILIKGIAIMGYLSYVIVPFPYIVICILFGRGITLPGAIEGIKFYLLKPDFSALLVGKTWAAALKQLLFSMSIGYGGLISLSSYSKPSNNFFRDSLIIIFGDTVMSVIGGVAAFSILGYLAHLSGKEVKDVVASGTSLAFIAYPEAISTMSVPWLWNALFFLMLLMLGVSSEIAYVEAFTGLVGDCFPKTKKKKWLTTLLTCLGCFIVGILMTTHSGWFWFNLFDEFTGSTCACLIAFIEVAILSFYGWKQIKQDLEEMRGEARFKGCCSWIGPRSPIFGIFWATVCPLLAITCAVLTLIRKVPYVLALDKSGKNSYTYPTWAEVIGWILNLAVILPIPAFFVYKWWRFRRDGISFHYLFRPTKELKSFSRYYEQRGICEPGETYSAMEEASTQFSITQIDYDKPAVINRHKSLRSEY